MCLTTDAKRVLFAACVARTVKGQLAFEAGTRPELEVTVARLEIDFPACVRPSAEMFWSLIKKDRMLAVASLYQNRVVTGLRRLSEGRRCRRPEHHPR